MVYDWETFLTIGWLALWFLFPLGIFLSVARLDKNSDELTRIEDLRFDAPPRSEEKPHKGFHLPHWGLRH